MSQWIGCKNQTLELRITWTNLSFSNRLINGVQIKRQSIKFEKVLSAKSLNIGVAAENGFNILKIQIILNI